MSEWKLVPLATTCQRCQIDKAAVILYNPLGFEKGRYCKRCGKAELKECLKGDSMTTPRYEIVVEKYGNDSKRRHDCQLPSPRVAFSVWGLGTVIRCNDCRKRYVLKKQHIDKGEYRWQLKWF